ncbi:tyrosine-type recombinase/integrase [Fluviispira sanaruensis]|uniref:Tyrosine recombinase n=1 Tax=Fluviispira sanaruensis TaxID=2493639 RepID=A0A4V0P286_FLUSA|nr:tyrosine-type recombinase/integrase [Fluviispira sanaruensis]BBH52357.1 tyrosine recombinase [Fluviispira sanaruensis]
MTKDRQDNSLSIVPISSVAKESLQHELHINTKNALSLWAQTPLTQNIQDAILHFIMSFHSPHTQKSYLNDLKNFISFTEYLNYKCENLNDISENLLILWHEYLNTQKKLSQKSIRRKLVTISSFFEFNIKRNLITENPMRFINLPKIKDESKTNAFTEEESKKIIVQLRDELQKILPDKISKIRQYKAAYLKYAVISTLFAIGMRVNELCEIKMGDLEFNNEFSRVHLKTKGNKDHFVFLHEKISEIIQNYIKDIRAYAKENDFLFIRTQGVKKETKLSQTAIYYMINSIAQKIGIEKKVSPHSCRATLATVLHKKGVPIANIQKILNHNSISTTAIYIKKADELQESAATKIDIPNFIPK